MDGIGLMYIVCCQVWCMCSVWSVCVGRIKLVLAQCVLFGGFGLVFGRCLCGTGLMYSEWCVWCMGSVCSVIVVG